MSKIYNKAICKKFTKLTSKFAIKHDISPKELITLHATEVVSIFNFYYGIDRNRIDIFFDKIKQDIKENHEVLH